MSMKKMSIKECRGLFIKRLMMTTYDYHMDRSIITYYTALVGSEKTRNLLWSYLHLLCTLEQQGICKIQSDADIFKYEVGWANET